LTWSYSTAAIKCRFVPLTGAERSELPGKFSDAKYRVYLKPNSGVTISHRLYYSSKYYKIVDIHKDSSNTYLVALVSEI